MKHIQLITRAFAASALALFAAASAHAANSDSTAQSDAAALQQLPRASLHVNAAKIEPQVGQYTMSNGMQLYISSRNHELVAGLDHQAPRRLRATGTTNVYTTPDGRMRLEFLRDETGPGPALRLTLLRPVESPNVASTVEPITLANVN